MIRISEQSDPAFRRKRGSVGGWVSLAGVQRVSDAPCSELGGPVGLPYPSLFLPLDGPSQVPNTLDDNMKRVQLEITGISCASCVQRVREALQAVPGVKAVDVIVGRAVIGFDDQACGVAELIRALRRGGRFEVGGFSSVMPS